MTKCDLEDTNWSPEIEEVLNELSIEMCMDEFKDDIEESSIFGCKAEAKAYIDCMVEHRPIYACYKDTGAYDQDYDSYRDEKCWQEIQRYYYCN